VVVWLAKALVLAVMVNQKIETAALKMDFVYVSKKVWWYSFNDTGSGLPSGTCIGVLQQECCSANSFNGLPEEKGVKKDWCEVQGCESSCLNVTRRLDQVDASHDVHHLRSSRIMQNKRSMIEGDFAGTDFNDVLGEYTTLDPLSTGAVLGPSNLEHDAECRANSYYAIDHNSPTLICEDYESNRCDANDYMIKKENETFCLNVVRNDCCLPKTLLAHNHYCALTSWLYIKLPISEYMFKSNGCNLSHVLLASSRSQ
jgi:hypothetical protein